AMLLTIFSVDDWVELGSATASEQTSATPSRFDSDAQIWSRREMLMFTPFWSVVVVVAALVTSGDENSSRISVGNWKLSFWNASATRRNSGSVSRQPDEFAK